MRYGERGNDKAEYKRINKEENLLLLYFLNKGLECS